MPEYFKDSSRTIGSHLGSLRYVHHLRERSANLRVSEDRMPSPDPIQFGISTIRKPSKKNKIGNYQSTPRSKPNLLNSPASNQSTTPVHTIDEENENEDTIATIQQAHSIQDLLPVLKLMDFKALKGMVLQYHDMEKGLRHNVTNDYSLIEEDTDTPALEPRSQSSNKREQLVVHNEHQKVIAKKGKNNSFRNGKKKSISFVDTVDTVDLKMQNTQSNKIEMIKESDTDESLEKGAFADDDEIVDQEMREIWQPVADRNDPRYALLIDLHGPLIKQFKSITKLNNIKFHKSQIKNWFIYSTKGQIEKNGMIFIGQFETFWKWFVSMSYIISDLYNIKSHREDTSLDIFYNKDDARKELKGKQVGTFMLILGKRCNELIILYVSKLNNKKINQVLLTRRQRYNDNKQYLYEYITNNDNKKHNIFEYIGNNLHLKKLYSTKRGLIDKNAVFYRR